MNRLETHPELPLDVAGMRNRLRDVGLVLVRCDEHGELASTARPEDDWLYRMLTASPIVRAGLREAAARWSCQVEPLSIEIVPGVWALGMPMINRRRRVGYIVALVPGQALLDSEFLPAMCQAAKLDALLVRTLLLQLPCATTAEIGRLAAMVRYIYEDHLRLGTETHAAESVGQHLAESYEEINLLYTIIQSMTVQQRPERFVAIACEELMATLSYAWIGTQLVDDRDRLKSLSGRLIVAGQPGQPAGSLRLLARELLDQVQPDTAMVLETRVNPRHAKFAPLGGTVVIQPVTSDDKVIGLLIAGDKQGADTSASSVDMKMLAATATHMSIFLENAALYDDLNAMFLGTLEALTASIDAKDRYTCGHSRRVAHLTQQLAEAVGLDEHTVQRMHIAGLVHDVGKIGVPEAVLLKPGKLNDEEFGWIRKHPEMGYRILKDIPQLQDILPGVLYHHERWDGRGYPDGLAGEAIPLAARLIGLADSFDAMSSTRTYRSALSRSEVLAEISKCVGKQFDPELARHFVNLDFTTFDRMVVEHRAGGLEVTSKIATARGEAA